MAPKEGERRFALSRLIALEAEDDDGVRGFRAKYLSEFPEGKIPWLEIADWIARQAAVDGPPTGGVVRMRRPEADLRAY